PGGGAAEDLEGAGDEDEGRGGNARAAPRLLVRERVDAHQQPHDGPEEEGRDPGQPGAGSEAEDDEQGRLDDGGETQRGFAHGGRPGGEDLAGDEESGAGEGEDD